MTMDLSTRYLGLDLAHPVVASASPLSRSLDGMKQLEDGGVSAIVMYSLFEEHIRHDNALFDHFLSQGANSFPEALDYFPTPEGSTEVGPDLYLDQVRLASQALDIPVIASLNGISDHGWIDYARLLEQAGAAGLELNIYYIPADLSLGGREVEERYLSIAALVKEAVTIPVAMKLNPYFSAPGDIAQRLDTIGIDGLVLFNRFYQPDLDIDRLKVAPTLNLSSPLEIRLPLRWLAILHKRINASLAASTGVESADEVVKYLLAGADAVMTTSALLRHGPSHAHALVGGLVEWLDEHGFEGVNQARGTLSQQAVSDPDAFERANYLQVLESYRYP